MLYILSGQDDFSLSSALDAIKRQFGDAASQDLGTTILDGKTVTPEELRNVCHTLPFMTSQRLVIAGGLLERFEPPARTSRRPKTTKASSAKEKKEESLRDKMQPFLAAMENLPETTTLVLTGGKADSKNLLFKEMSPRAKVEIFAPLQGARLQDWIRSRVTGQGGSISPRGITSLTRLVGSNLWILSGEIDKLVLFAGGRQIEEADVTAMVGYSQETSVFSLVDAVLESRTEAAEKLLQQLLLGGAAPSYLLTMLARQVQLIVRAKEMKRRKTPNNEIQSKLGQFNDFVFRKTLDQAGRHSLERLKSAYHLLLDTDMAIKTGKIDAELALTIMTAEMAGAKATAGRSTTG